MSDETVFLARTVCVRPHHDGDGSFEIAWGEGSARESFKADSAVLASAIATSPAKTLISDETARIGDLLGISRSEAGALLDGLRGYGLYSDQPDDLTAAEDRWLDVGWADGLDFHLATHDAMWVHDYTGNPKVMTRYFVDRRLDPETPPPSRYPAPAGDRVQLPPANPVPTSLTDIQARRRTSRAFKGTSISLADAATIIDSAFAPHWPQDDPTFHTAQTYSRGAPFVAFALFAGDGAPAEVRRDFAAYQFDPIAKTLVYRRSAEISAWSDLLWRQDYANEAPMIVVLCADWQQYMWKYRTSRAYRWPYIECGAFMHTALTAATGLGLRTFQTPAIDDARMCDLLGVDDAEVGPIYLAAFGRSVTQ